jgi:hypothetical protein
MSIMFSHRPDDVLVLQNTTKKIANYLYVAGGKALFYLRIVSITAVLALSSACAGIHTSLGVSVPIGRAGGVGVSIGSGGTVSGSVGVGAGGGSVSVGASGQLPKPDAPADGKAEDKKEEKKP